MLKATYKTYISWTFLPCNVKEKSENTENRKNTNDAMTKRKTMVDRTLLGSLKIEQHKPD